VLQYSDAPPRLWAGSRLGWWEYAGIARTAQIESSPLQSLCKLAVTADPQADGAGKIEIEGLAYNAGAEKVSASLSARLSDLQAKTMLLFRPRRWRSRPAGGGIQVGGTLPDVQAWSPDTPGHRYG